MAETPHTRQGKTHMAVYLDPEEHRLIHQAAAKDAKPAATWAREILERVARKRLEAGKAT